ncbi:MAG: PTS sugar transporter subunit IIA [Bacteroides sp.]
MGLFTKKKLPAWNPGTLGSITQGKVMPVTEVKDEVFSQKMLGDGVAFLSEDGVVVSPCDGTVTAFFHTNHAIGLTTQDGAEVLIHIGLDTVKEGGRGFKGYVKEGDAVKRGQKLITFDKEVLEEKGYDLSIPMIISNIDAVENIKALMDGTVTTEDDVLAYSPVQE